ncbi:MAG: hypothetical protein ABH881_00055 [bacterium]
MKYNNYLVLIVPIIVYILLSVLYGHHNLIYVVLVLIALLLAFTVRQFVLAGKNQENWWNFFILPFFFTVSFVVFCALIPDIVFWKFSIFNIISFEATLVKSFFLLNSIFLYYYLRLAYCCLIKTDFHQHNRLENFSSGGNFLCFYFLISSIYGLQIYLNISIWILMIIMTAVTALITYEIMWANKIEIESSFLYILFICLAIVELSWSASFLTLSYYILGLIIAMCYYVLIGLTKFYLLGVINKKIVKLYLSFGFISIFIVLLTARWL